MKVHYTGGHVDVRIVDDHDRCLQLMRQIQDHHMDGNGWIDFAYNLAACPHGRMIQGRGAGVLSAANGSGLNTGHYAVLALLGNSGYRVPTPGLLAAVRDGIDYLRKNGAGNEIKGHRDGYDTDCPGDPLYAWVRKGAPRPEEDDVTRDEIYEAAWKTDAMPVPYARAENPKWKPESVLVDHGVQIRKVQAEIAGLGVTIRELVALLAQRDEAIDVEALVARIRSEIERVTVRLDVAE
ncbi:peptidoglycan recognition protein family protein [Nonomuraea rubra]